MGPPLEAEDDENVRLCKPTRNGSNVRPELICGEVA